MVDELGTVGRPFSLSETVGCLPAGATWTGAVIRWGDGTTSPGTITSIWSSPEGDLAGVAVTGQHTYGQPGSFAISIAVTNQVGETYEGGWHTSALVKPSSSPSSPPCPTGGCQPTKPYVPPEVPWANQSGNEAAKRTVAEQRAQEQQEQQAKEPATKGAALEHPEGQDRQAAEREGNAACRVPALTGETLTDARRVLRRAHCRLGAVHKPAHHCGALYVSAQGAPAGKRLPRGARVALALGSKASGARQA